MAAALTIAVGLSGCYATRMALHHNELFNSRRSVDDVVADPATAEKTRAQLLKVRDVLTFAAGEGLNTHGAYRYFIATEEPVVSYLVEAAYADRLESVTWWFPFVGSVPYRGYFKKAERDDKAAELRADGYDVDEGAAGAFSSLGWFDDPIFSSMLERGDADLAHLFFHELTHRTLWVPGSPEFNENLAEYVGSVLTVKYFQANGDHGTIERYEAKAGDRKLFHDWLVALRADLDALFKNDAKRSRVEILRDKAAIYATYMQPPKKPAFKVADYVGKEPWNNAGLLGASLYSPDTAAFAKAHRCLKSAKVSVFLADLKRMTDETDDPFIALGSLCR